MNIVCFSVVCFIAFPFPIRLNPLMTVKVGYERGPGVLSWHLLGDLIPIPNVSIFSPKSALKQHMVADVYSLRSGQPDSWKYWKPFGWSGFRLAPRSGVYWNPYTWWEWLPAPSRDVLPRSRSLPSIFDPTLGFKLPPSDFVSSPPVFTLPNALGSL